MLWLNRIFQLTPLFFSCQIMNFLVVGDAHFTWPCAVLQYRKQLCDLVRKPDTPRRIGLFFVHRIVRSGISLVYVLFFAKSKIAPIPTPIDNPNPAPEAIPVEMSPNTIPKEEPKSNPKQAPRAIPFPDFLFFFSSISLVKSLIFWYWRGLKISIHKIFTNWFVIN